MNDNQIFDCESNQGRFSVTDDGGWFRVWKWVDCRTGFSLNTRPVRHFIKKFRNRDAAIYHAREHADMLIPGIHEKPDER